MKINSVFQTFTLVSLLLIMTMMSSASSVGNIANYSVNQENEPLKIEYSTFFGDIGEDDGYSLALDQDGNIYITGATRSQNFQVTDDAFEIANPSYGRSVFLAKFSSDFEVLYSTYLGGSDTDTGTELALDSQGNIFVVGVTRSDDFPITEEAYDTTFGGGTLDAPGTCCGDGFLSKFSPQWELEFSTYIGGNDSEADLGLSIDGNDNIIVSGMTKSLDFNTTHGAFQEDLQGGRDYFTTKFDNDGNIIFSTLLGGSEDEVQKGGGTSGKSVVVDSDDNIYVSGGTQSTDFPTTDGAYNQTFGGNTDIFVSKLSSNGSELLYSTYIGGSGHEVTFASTIDPYNNYFIIGTAETGIPTITGAFQETSNGGTCLSFGDGVPNCGDGFVLKLSPNDNNLQGSYFGGFTYDIPLDVALDSMNNPIIVGFHASHDFPTTDPDNYNEFQGGVDLFVTKFNSSNFNLIDSLMIGGNTEYGSFELANGNIIDENDDVIFTGFTFAHNFPTTTDAIDNLHNGDKDIILVKLSHTEGTFFEYVASTTSEKINSDSSDSSITNIWILGIVMTVILGKKKRSNRNFSYHLLQ